MANDDNKPEGLAVGTVTFGHKVEYSAVKEKLNTTIAMYWSIEFLSATLARVDHVYVRVNNLQLTCSFDGASFTEWSPACGIPL